MWIESGKWACLECLWFPLLAKLTNRLSGSLSLRSSPTTAPAHTLFQCPRRCPRPGHPGWAVAAAAAPWPWCPPRVPHPLQQPCQCFPHRGRGCPANSAHLCIQGCRHWSDKQLEEMLLWELPPRFACRAQWLSTSNHSWTRCSPFILPSSHAYTAVNTDSFRERLEISC